MKATSSYFLYLSGAQIVLPPRKRVFYLEHRCQSYPFIVFGLFSQLIKVLQAGKEGFGLGFQSLVCELVGHGEPCYIMSELNNSKPQK